jgi:hypothetical protein
MRLTQCDKKENRLREPVFFLLLVERVELQELDSVVDHESDDEEINKNAQEIAPENRYVTNINTRLFEAVSCPQEHTEDWVDDIRHERRHHLGDRATEDKPDRQPDYPLLSNKFHETGQCLHSMCPKIMASV